MADPDPDGADLFQIAVGLLEQVTHQLIQATLDCHLGSRKGVLHQGLGEDGGGQHLQPAASAARGARAEVRRDRGWLRVTCMEMGARGRIGVLTS